MLIPQAFCAPPEPHRQEVGCSHTASTEQGPFPVTIPSVAMRRWRSSGILHDADWLTKELTVFLGQEEHAILEEWSQVFIHLLPPLISKREYYQNHILFYLLHDCLLYLLYVVKQIDHLATDC